MEVPTTVQLGEHIRRVEFSFVNLSALGLVQVNGKTVEFAININFDDGYNGYGDSPWNPVYVVLKLRTGASAGSVRRVFLQRALPNVYGSQAATTASSRRREAAASSEYTAQTCVSYDPDRASSQSGDMQTEVCRSGMLVVVEASSSSASESELSAGGKMAGLVIGMLIGGALIVLGVLWVLKRWQRSVDGDGVEAIGKPKSLKGKKHSMSVTPVPGWMEPHHEHSAAVADGSNFVNGPGPELAAADAAWAANGSRWVEDAAVGESDERAMRASLVRGSRPTLASGGDGQGHKLPRLPSMVADDESEAAAGATVASRIPCAEHSVDTLQDVLDDMSGGSLRSE